MKYTLNPTRVWSVIPLLGIALIGGSVLAPSTTQAARGNDHDRRQSDNNRDRSGSNDRDRNNDSPRTQAARYQSPRAQSLSRTSSGGGGVPAAQVVAQPGSQSVSSPVAAGPADDISPKQPTPMASRTAPVLVNGSSASNVYKPAGLNAQATEVVYALAGAASLVGLALVAADTRRRYGLDQVFARRITTTR